MNKTCRICAKEYEDDEVERTITFLEDGLGMEYVVCEKCYIKYKQSVEKNIKYRR